MKFKSKPEAYSYALILINQLRAKKILENSDLVAPFGSCINKLKISFENHEQDPRVVANHLEELKHSAKLLNTELDKINQLQLDLIRNDYRQSTEEKYKSPLARRAESELPLVLLSDPTPAMMISIKRVSDELLKIIDDQGDNFKNFLPVFLENYHVIALGSLKAPITTQTIKEILQNNDPAKLAEIMHIHFKFSQSIIRDIAIKNAPRREPVGKLAEIVRSLWTETQDPKDFFSVGLANNWEGRKYRAYISDELMYRSDLYTAAGNRGRDWFFDATRTQQLGLMLKGQEEHEVGFPIHRSSWAADCKSQSANYNSPYVQDLVENDAVYVAGPSGMTSMFLNQMEILGNFENEDLKKNYLSAVVSYIVGGGFHSLHEVIGPAEKALGLIPGYKVEVPSYDRLASPPNYNQFFAQQEAIDPDFANRRDLAWQNYLNFVNDSYAPKYIEDFQQEDLNFPQMSLEVPHIAEGDNLSRQDERPLHNDFFDRSDIIPRRDNLIRYEQPLSRNEVDIDNHAIVANVVLTPSNHHKVPQELKNSILREMNNYIKDGVLSRGDKIEQLSFISRVFRNCELTRKKLDISIEFRNKVQSSTTTLEQLKDLVAQLKRENLLVEQAAGKTYCYFTKSGLNRAMESIETDIINFEQNNSVTLNSSPQ